MDLITSTLYNKVLYSNNPPLILLHTNLQKRLPSNTTHALQIKLLNHRPQLTLLKTILTQLLRHTPKIIQINVPLASGIEELKRAKNLLLRIAV